MTGIASIVITTFNRRDLLRRAIDGALAQTHPCEVVVCDHGSRDATPEVAASCGARTCDRSLVLERGKLVYGGSAVDAVRQCWRLALGER